MRNKRIPQRMELCLCSRCARVFYESPDYYIERTDIYQTVLDECDFCSYRQGYDFTVLSVSHNRKGAEA